MNEYFDGELLNGYEDSPITYVYGGNLEECHKVIADLEAKLAESEKKVKHWHNLYNERDKQFQSVRQRYHLLNKLQSNYDKKDKLHLAYMQCAELVDENEQLKQQLAEKDKEIKQLKLDLRMFKSVTEFLNCYGIEKAREVLFQTEKTKNQDKISFAIEKLVGVQKYISDNAVYVEEESFGREINNFIDNQIKQLKEMK